MFSYFVYLLDDWIFLFFKLKHLALFDEEYEALHSKISDLKRGVILVNKWIYKKIWKISKEKENKSIKLILDMEINGKNFRKMQIW